MSLATVLVTGATGFIGGATTAQLLDDTRADRLLLLVRAPSESAAWERVQKSLARFKTSSEVQSERARIGILLGDICDGEALADPRLDAVTHVLHAAANTSFRSIREVHRTNVLGTLALAHRMLRAPQLQRFVHVSTAYCCGATAAAVVHEDHSPRSEASHMVEYTRSKAESEIFLNATAPDLPLVIARPSVVIGHTELGCTPFTSLFWYYHALSRIGRAPFCPQQTRDIVPVDYVAEAPNGCARHRSSPTTLIAASRTLRAVVYMKSSMTTSSELRCSEVLSPDAFKRLMRRAIFDCFKWHIQHGDDAVLCPFPLVIDAGTWRRLAAMAENLAREALRAEQEMLTRPDIQARLGLSRRLPWLLGMGAAPTRSGPRFSRFDFHPTDAGFRISEENIDVAGGIIESSGVTALMASSFPALRPAGDPAGALAAALCGCAGPGGRVGLMHLTQYTEDRQIMLYLARRLAERGMATCLFDPTQLRFRNGHAEVLVLAGRAALDVVYRFFPAEWLERLPAATRWVRAIVGGRTPFTNPGSAVLTQSKRFPLVWDDLTTSLDTWRSLLPETRSLDEVAWRGDDEWVIKPALGHEGDRIGIAGVTGPERYEELAREASHAPQHWVAQRRFFATPIHTPLGLRYPSIGVFVLDGQAVGAYGRLARQPLIDDSAQEAVVLLTKS